MDHFVIKRHHVLYLFNDHKEMSAWDILVEVVPWNSNLFRNNPVETWNQKMPLFNHMKREVKRKYDTLMKMNYGLKKDDELKKFMKEIYAPTTFREKKNEGIVSPRKRKLKSRLCKNCKRTWAGSLKTRQNSLLI